MGDMNISERMLLHNKKKLDQIRKSLELQRGILSAECQYNIIRNIAKHQRKFNDFAHDILESFRKATYLNQVENINERMIRKLSEYSNKFLISISIFEMYRQSEIRIPEQLLGFQTLLLPLINATNHLSVELETFISDPSPILYDSIPSNLIAPVLSGSLHFRMLKAFQFIDTSNDTETTEEYMDIVDSHSLEAEAKIKDLDNCWYNIIKGAKETYISKNPDKVRHVSISLRELIGDILHNLAPDEKIKSKLSDKKYYKNNKPTRQARLKYILCEKKNYSSKIYKLLDKDIEAAVELYNLLSGGVHKINSYEENDFEYIYKRAMLLISQLL